MLTFRQFIENASDKTLTFTPAEVRQLREEGGDAVFAMGKLQADGSLVVPVRYLAEAAEDLLEFQDDSDTLFEMSNLRPQDTGLPFVVWISVKGSSSHDVRIKVSRGPKARPSEMISVAIRPDVRVVGGSLSASELAALRKWVDLNRDVLIQYWNAEIGTKEAVNAIRPIS